MGNIHGGVMDGGELFGIHTLCSPVFLCWPLGCLGVLLLLWTPFLKQGISTHLHTPSSSVIINMYIIIIIHGCDGFSQAVSDHPSPRQLGDSSEIVTICQLNQG